MKLNYEFYHINYYKHVLLSGYMGGYIENPVKLRFDPENIEIPCVKDIFKDDVARTFWMGIKQRHLASQYFNEDCERAAEYIRKNGMPKSPAELLKILHTKFVSGHGYNLDFAKELFPYIIGEKKLEYVIET